ncbi:MAG: bifunctional (p)ppGpp synthetase/guanosine-3',5'-bis(diphosphate) 3'-pyrophosphohydrolase [Bacteroidales bacterium]|nr:bifunctional (p)ppGpp synthetase/guanosine-3',5'-bis(diphosphate) 3'-pyrophosphohydrolase [Candidatus Equimonas enterica]
MTEQQNTFIDMAAAEAFGLDAAAIEAQIRTLAKEAIGLHDWQPTQEAIAAFQRVYALVAGRGEETLKTDNFRNLLVSQAGDMRIILLLIAQCVVLMRSVKDTAAVAEQHRLATEAASIYAPLAHKLGLYQLKSELEDLSLKYLEHDAYYLIKSSLNATKATREAYIEAFIAPIRHMLDEEGLTYHIKGRTKSIHSIWQKMKKQKCGFEGVYDLFAIRIILDVPLKQEKAQCWKVFSLITAEYESNVKRLRDWLTVPKPNGYESLHITVKGPEDKWVEVQIRTERMDDIAEHGLAAHWRYKGVKATNGGVDAWLAGIRAALETNDEHLLTDSLSSGLQQNDVYIFTPRGDLFRLPTGATVLDFAYHIHTAVGSKCVGAVINGRNVSLRTPLESGQTVEIKTSNTQRPKLEWLSIVVSPQAKAKIRAAVKELETKDGEFARELLERKIKNRKLEWDETIINHLIHKSGYKEATEFYKAIAMEDLDAGELVEHYVELANEERDETPKNVIRSADEFVQTAVPFAAEDDIITIDRQLKGIDFQMAHCCSPVYGDKVFGFVTRGGGIKIHRDTCPNAEALKKRFPYRIVKAQWAGNKGETTEVTLHITGQDDLGIVNNVTSILSKDEHVMLRSISIDTSDGLFFGTLTILTEDTTRLSTIIKKIRTVPGVKAVSR